MGVSDVRKSDEPHSRLTILCDQMLDVFDGEDTDDVRAIVLLNSEDEGGVTIHNYDDDGQAVMDIFQHLEAIFEANGLKLALMPIPGQG
jgi:hypothetical protein